MQADRVFMIHDGNAQQRNLWEFEYTAKEVAKGAREQLAYRRTRLKVWESEKQKIIAKIKRMGLTLNESVAEKMVASSSYNATRSGRQAAKFTVNESLQEDLDECLGKIETHRTLEQQYAAWVQVLDAKPTQTIKLKHGDWMFFFGKL